MCIVFIISNISSKLELKNLAVYLKKNALNAVFLFLKLLRVLSCK